jgi:hypothetical protein
MPLYHYCVDPALDPRRALVDRKVQRGGGRGCRTACAVYAAGGMAGIGYGNCQAARCRDGRRRDRGGQLVRGHEGGGLVLAVYADDRVLVEAISVDR